jgi:uncharacterized protein (TIGR02145 family)
MKVISLFFLIYLLSLSGLGQGIRVTFQGTGAATIVDSVEATNLRTNKTVALPGHDALNLTTNTGIQLISELMTSLSIYPNPFSGQAIFIANVQKSQKVNLRVSNLVGQIVAQTITLVQSGGNEFALVLANPGIYVISFTAEEGTTSLKALCTNVSDTKSSIQYLGPTLNNGNGTSQSEHKYSQTGYTLEYMLGDIILYKCKSGNYTTIVTDSPVISKTYSVEFLACQDKFKNNYSIVKIGNQRWMAENLSYLPSVSPPSVGSNSLPHYYVYGYDGSDVNKAKKEYSFRMNYGVLYNWQAARISCPMSWHLPTDEDWTTLAEYLGPFPGSQLKETRNAHWGGDATNSVGFTAVAGGGLSITSGSFSELGTHANFWSLNSTLWRLGWDNTRLSHYGGGRSSGLSVRCMKTGTDNNTSPTADFTIRPQVGSIWTMFEFDASTSFDVESTPGELQFRWDFNGDGIWDTSFDSTKIKRHQFDSAGTYSIVLEVIDGFALADTMTKSLAVADAGGDGTFADNRDGRVYQYKTIAQQTWMTENLAFLPTVGSSNYGSDTIPFYYVYGYEGININDAKATANFATYKVLYNWEAAKISCPEGWHLPTDEEWTNLEIALTGGNFGYGGSGDDIGKALATTSGWKASSKIGTIGNNQENNNSSGFMAAPGGLRYHSGGFFDLSQNAYFWTSSEHVAPWVWHRYLKFDGANLERYYGNLKSTGLSVRCLKD